jgi:hypothetical protein
MKIKPKKEKKSIDQLRQNLRDLIAGKNSLPYESVKNRAVMSSAIEQLDGEIFYWLGEASKSSTVSSDRAQTKKARFWQRVFEKIDRDVDVLVDLGSGVRPINQFDARVHICVEKFPPYLEYLKSKFNNTNIVIIAEDCLKFLQSQPSNSIDSVVAIDVIEHLDRENGLKMITEIERVVSAQAIIFTPLGFMENHLGENDEHFWGWSNELQTHLSGYTPDDFQSWDCIIDKDYHLDIGIECGAFAAVYKKKASETQKFKEQNSKSIQVVVGTSILESSDLWNLMHDRLCQYAGWAKIDVQFILPISCAPFSHVIYPNIKFPSKCLYYSENPAINASKAGDFQLLHPRFINLHYFIDNSKDSVIILDKTEPGQISKLHFLSSSVLTISTQHELMEYCINT